MKKLLIVLLVILGTVLVVDERGRIYRIDDNNTPDFAKQKYYEDYERTKYYPRENAYWNSSDYEGYNNKASIIELEVKK